MDGQFVVEFGLGGNGTDVAKRGWSEPEPEFRWMVGLDSTVVLPRPAAAAGYQLSLDVRPHIRPTRLPKQALIVAANDVIVGVFEIVRDMPVTCDVPPLAIELADELTLRLVHPNAESPRAVADIPDDRMLAVAVERIELRWFGKPAASVERAAAITPSGDPLLNGPPHAPRAKPSRRPEGISRLPQATPVVQLRVHD